MRRGRAAGVFIPTELPLEQPGLQSAQMTNISVPAAKENAVFFREQGGQQQAVNGLLISELF